jgi:uncharacterized lipoprotein YmbA
MIMSKNISSWMVVTGLVAVTTFCGGCISGQSQEPDYFVLETIASEKPTEADFLEGNSFHVSQTEIPVYLDGSRMVSRSAVNKLSYSEFHRWSETLDVGITRVVANDLSAALGVLNYSHYPNRTRPGNRYEISLTVKRFERAPSGEMIFEGHWRLFCDREQKLINELNESAAVQGLGHSAAVGAMSMVLRRVSDRIALRLLEYVEKEPSPENP